MGTNLEMPHKAEILPQQHQAHRTGASLDVKLIILLKIVIQSLAEAAPIIGIEKMLTCVVRL